MSRLVYADTSALIALVYAGDQAHQRVAKHFRAMRAAGDRFVTCEPVITETVSRLRYDAGLLLVRRFRSVLDRASVDRTFTVRESSDALRRAAFDIIERFADVRVSYADAVGAAIAGERRVDAVFSLDNDFRIMGLTVEP